MRDFEKTTGLTISWMPVVDGQGRTHMEAHWVTASPTPVPASAPPQTAHAA